MAQYLMRGASLAARLTPCASHLPYLGQRADRASASLRRSDVRRTTAARPAPGEQPDAQCDVSVQPAPGATLRRTWASASKVETNSLNHGVLGATRSLRDRRARHTHKTRLSAPHNAGVKLQAAKAQRPDEFIVMLAGVASLKQRDLSASTTR